MSFVMLVVLYGSEAWCQKEKCVFYKTERDPR